MKIKTKIGRILVIASIPPVLIGILSVNFLSASFVSAAAPDCSKVNFSRCLNTGYFTGSTDTDDATLPLLFPIEPNYTYTESCHALPIPITKWSFTSVACNSRNNPAYTLEFVNQIGSYLTDFCDSELFPLSTTSTCGLRRRNGIAAAQIVNTMLGKNGTDFGTHQWSLLCPGGSQWYLDCYERAIIDGVNEASSSFAKWRYLVIRYDQLGRINWNGIETYTPGDINSGGINYGTDVDFHTISHGGWSNRIIFEDGSGNRIYGINRNCGNLVGNLQPLEIPPDATPSTTPIPSALFGGDDESPTKVTLNARSDQTSPAYSVVVTRSIYIVRSGSTIQTSIPGYPDETWSGSGSHTFGTVEINDPPNAPLNLNLGDEICVSVTIDRPAVKILSDGTIIDIPGGTPTDKSCKRIVNKPYLNFLGGDVATGGDFEGAASCSGTGGIKAYRKTSTGFGSGVAFAAMVFGTGTVDTTTDFATGMAQASPVAGSLVFAKPSGALEGNHCIKDYFKDFMATGVIPKTDTDVDVSSVVAGWGNGNYRLPGGISLHGNLPNNLRARLYVDGDLYVTDSIRYINSNWADMNAIPSLHVYVRGNIYIEEDVTEMVGMFVAQPKKDVGGNPVPGTGQVVTCTGPAGAVIGAAALFGRCNAPLKVKGALVANKVKWLRTANSLRNGSSADRTLAGSRAAETVELTPEFLMVAPPDVDPGDLPYYQFFTTLPPVL